MKIFRIAIFLALLSKSAYGTLELDNNLVAAVKTDDIASAKALIAQGADPCTTYTVSMEAQDHFALEIAAGLGKSDMVKLLYSSCKGEKRQNAGMNAFLTAIASNRQDIVEYFLAQRVALSKEAWVTINKTVTLNDAFLNETREQYRRIFATPLFTAAASGYPHLVELLLKSGANPNQKNSRANVTALSAAFRFGCPECYVKIFEHPKFKRAQIVKSEMKNAYHRAMKLESQPIMDAIIALDLPATTTDLISAARHGNIEVLKHVLKSIKPDSKEPVTDDYAIMVAANNQQWQAVRILVEAGSKPGKFPILQLLLGRDNTGDLFDYLLANGADGNKADITGETALHAALLHKHIEEAKKMLARKPNLRAVDQHGKTILHYACNSDDPANAKLLLSYPVEVNVEDKDGNTPLMIAAEKGHAEVVSLLIKQGANVNSRSRDHYANPVYAAVKGRNISILREIIAAGGNVNLKRYDNSTPLHEAVSSGSVEMTQVLLAQGAKLNVKDSEGKTPLDYATPLTQEQKDAGTYDGRDENIVKQLQKMLINAGAK